MTENVLFSIDFFVLVGFASVTITEKNLIYKSTFRTRVIPLDYIVSVKRFVTRVSVITDGSVPSIDIVPDSQLKKAKAIENALNEILAKR